MSHPPDGSSWDWIARASGIAGLAAAAYAIGVKVFSFVTRQELTKITAAQNRQFLEAQNRMQAEVDRQFREHREERIRIADEQRAETLRLHGDNKETFEEVFARTSRIEQGQARIEGRIEGLLEQLKRPDP